MMRKYLTLMSLMSFGLLLVLSSCRPPEVEGTVINLQKNLMDDAYASAQAAVQKYPENAEAQFYWGFVNGEHKKDYATMNEAFEKALSLNPAQAVSFQSGSVKLEEAVNQYRTSQFAENYNSAVKMVNKAQQEEDKAAGKEIMGKALDKLETAMAIAPGRSEPVQPLAVANLFLGDSTGAASVLDDAMSKFADDETVLLTAGDVFLRLGNVERSADAFKKALEKNPENAAIYQQLGQMEANQQNWSKANEYFAKAIELDPENGDLSYNIAVTYYNQQQYAEAIPFFKKAIESNPDINTMKILGICYVQHEASYDEAIPFLEDAVVQFPEDSTMWEYLAIIYGKKGMGDKADAAFKKSKELKAMQP